MIKNARHAILFIFCFLSGSGAHFPGRRQRVVSRPSLLSCFRNECAFASSLTLTNAGSRKPCASLRKTLSIPSHQHAFLPMNSLLPQTHSAVLTWFLFGSGALSIRSLSHRGSLSFPRSQIDHLREASLGFFRWGDCFASMSLFPSFADWRHGFGLEAF